MTRDKQLAAGVLALVLFGGLALKQMRDDEKLGSKAAQEAALPKFETLEGAEKLTVTNGDKGEVVLEKQGSDWQLVKPLATKANGQNVKLALDNLAELKVREQVAATPDAELTKSYELDGAKGVHVVVSKGGKSLLDVTFGKSGGRGQLLSVTGTPAIFAATGFSSYLFTRETKGWRDAEVTKFDEAKVTALHYVIGKRTLDFALSDTTWSGSEGGKPIERFDGERTRDALRAMQTLTADDFADGKADADLGLEKPTGELTFELKEGASIKLAIGAETPSKGRWVRRAGSTVATALPSYAVDWLLPETSKFQKAAADAGK